MSQAFDPLPDYPANLPFALEPVEALPPRKKGCAALAWLFIIGLIVFEVGWREKPKMKEAGGTEERIVFDIQGRYLVGAGNFFPANSKELFEQAQAALGEGDLGQELRLVVLAGELVGPQESLARLGRLDNLKATKDEERLERILGKLYEDYVANRFTAPSVTAAERAFLHDKLGWFGDLALHSREAAQERKNREANGPEPLPKDNLVPDTRNILLGQARSAFVTILSAVVSVGIAGFGGFIGLVVFLILLAMGSLRGGITIAGSRHGGVYAETFALYMAAYLGIGFAFSTWEIGPEPLIRWGLTMISSMLVLVWPRLRGIPWRQIRQDIGWTLGRNPVVEPAAGLACYAMGLPIILVGVLMTLVLMGVKKGLAVVGFAADQGIPMHPIVEFVVHGDTWTRIQVFILACVLAPLVEETMFRGVLYRHLRELTGGWHWLASVVCSGTIVSFLFAIIHPPGIVGVPALMGVAYALTIAREWRGSLIGSMAAHGFHNGMIFLILILLLGN